MFTREEAFWLAVAIGCMGFALWGSWHPHSVGWAIGAFAFVGIIVAYRLGPAPWWEKIVWVFISLVFVKLEFQAIQRNDDAQTAALQRQDEQFQRIIGELNDQLAASKTQLATSATQYQTTIGQVNETLKTTQKAANLTNESVRGLTGGSSYLEVDFTYPFWVSRPPPGEIGFTVMSAGKYPLWDVNVDWFEGDPLARGFQERHHSPVPFYRYG